MTFMVQYRGEIEDISRLNSFEDCILRLTLCLGGHAHLWREPDNCTHMGQTGGLLLFLAGGLEACSLIVSPDRMLVRPRDVQHLSRCRPPEAPWCNVDTTLSGPAGHMMLIEVLNLMHTYWFPRLQVIDSTRYWQHRSIEKLFREWDATKHSRPTELWNQCGTTFRHWDRRFARELREMFSVLAFGLDFTLIRRESNPDSRRSFCRNCIDQTEAGLRSSEFLATISIRNEHQGTLQFSQSTADEPEPMFSGEPCEWSSDDEELEEPEDLFADEQQQDDTEISAIRNQVQVLYDCGFGITNRCYSGDGHAAAYDSHLVRFFRFTNEALNMFRPRIHSIYELGEIAARLERGQQSARCCSLAAEGLYRLHCISRKKADVVIREFMTLDNMLHELVDRCTRMGDDLQNESA